MDDKKKFSFWVKVIIVAAVATLIVIYFPQVLGIVKNIIGMFMPFIIGGMIAFVLNIPMRAIEGAIFKNAKHKFWLAAKRPISIVITLILGALFVSILSMAVIPQAVDTAKTLPGQVTKFYASTIHSIDKFMVKHPDIAKTAMVEVDKLRTFTIDWDKVFESIKTFFVNGIGGSFVKNTFSFAGKIGSGIFNGIVSIIFSIYVLAQKEKIGNQFKRVAAAVLPEKAFNYTMKVYFLLFDNFSKFIAGQCVEAVILGVLTMTAMLIFRFDYAFLVAVIVAVTSLIPIVGGFIGAGIGAFLFLIQDPIKALWFILLFFVVSQIEGNVFYPNVVGSSVGLPSVWVLVAFAIGGSLFGIVGILTFIPLTSTVYTLVRDFANEKNSQKEWAREALERHSYTFVSSEEQRRRKGGAFGNLIKLFTKKRHNSENGDTQTQSTEQRENNNKRNKRGRK